MPGAEFRTQWQVNGAQEVPKGLMGAWGKPTANKSAPHMKAQPKDDVVSVWISRGHTELGAQDWPGRWPRGADGEREAGQDRRKEPHGGLDTDARHAISADDRSRGSGLFPDGGQPVLRAAGKWVR